SIPARKSAGEGSCGANSTLARPQAPCAGLGQAGIIQGPETVCPERVRHPPGTPKAQIPPGNAQAQERQTALRGPLTRRAGLLESGGASLHPPKGSGALEGA